MNMNWSEGMKLLREYMISDEDGLNGPLLIAWTAWGDTEARAKLVCLYFLANGLEPPHIKDVYV